MHRQYDTKDFCASAPIWIIIVFIFKNYSAYEYIYSHGPMRVFLKDYYTLVNLTYLLLLTPIYVLGTVHITAKPTHWERMTNKWRFCAIRFFVKLYGGMSFVTDTFFYSHTLYRTGLWLYLYMFILHFKAHPIYKFANNAFWVLISFNYL